MTTAVAPAASPTNLLSSYATQTQTATQTAEQQMANSTVTGAAAGTSASSVASDYNTFLQILTTQLQNQDPTDPTDTNQFTQELVEFSGVEQQLNTNNLLQQLVNASGAGGVKSLLGYVGQYVEVPANNQVLVQGGESDFSYTLPSAAQTVSITIADSAGNTVATLNGPTSTGVNDISWNGEDSNGDQLPDGVYSMAISASDSNGNPISPSAISLIGQVTGVQTADSSGNDLLLGNSLVVNDANVEAVFSPSVMQANNNNSSNSSTSSGS